MGQISCSSCGNERLAMSSVKDADSIGTGIHDVLVFIIAAISNIAIINNNRGNYYSGYVILIIASLLEYDRVSFRQEFSISPSAFRAAAIMLKLNNVKRSYYCN